MDFSILSIYDDFLANYFLDNLLIWFPTLRMNSNTECGVVDATSAIPIIRQLTQDLNPAKATKELLKTPYFQEFLRNKQERQVSEFSQHMRRYLCMFMPTAGFEVNSTTRYTGKMEARIVATQDWKVGQHVSLCQGSIAKLTTEEDERLKSEGRDFSVMVSTRKRCACLFLGPARFMNHDCDANCEFIIVGSNAVTFKVNRDIKMGQEMTVFYGKHYFGEDNCECLCASCERRQEGSFSKSGKSVALTKPPVKEDTSPIRRSSRKRKEPNTNRGYGSEKRLKKAHPNHVDPNEQSESEPKDGNQCAPTSSTITDENTLHQLEDSLAPDTANDDPQQINDTSVIDVEVHSKDASSLPDDILPVEEGPITKENPTQLSNDTIQASADVTELDMVDSSQECNAKLDGHGEMPNQDSGSSSEESIVPDVSTCDKEEDIANEYVPAVDNNSITLETPNEDIETHPQLDDDDGHDHDDDLTILLTSQIDDQQIQVSDGVQEQTQANEEIALSEGYRKPEIECSEGLSKRADTNTSAEGGKDTIRLVKSVVIDLASRKDLPIQKNRASKIRNVWISTNNDDDQTDKNDVKMALEELKQDIEKKNCLESSTRNSLLHDMHAFAMERNKDQELNAACGEITVDSHGKRNEAIQKEDWLKSASASVCHSVDLTLSHSETASTCSVTTPADNSSARDEYTLTPEPERVWGTPTRQADSLETKTISKMMEDSYTQNRSNQDNCSSSITSPNPNVIAEEGLETTTQTLDISTIQHLDHSKQQQQQQEKNEMMGGLCRSDTSYSNDSTCFSSNYFDTTDTNSSVSISFNNDDIYTQQGHQEEPGHRHQDVCLTLDLKDKSSDATTVNAIPASTDTHDITNEKDVQSNTPISPLIHISDSVDSSSCTSKTTTLDNASNHLDTSDSLELSTTTSNIDTNTSLMNTDTAVINTTASPVLDITGDTNTNTEITDSSLLKLRIPSKPIKRCCPEFDTYNQGGDPTQTMCPRCTRHLAIFGVEWPKRIGRRRPKNKAKGAKANQKKDIRIKPTIPKQRANPSTHIDFNDQGTQSQVLEPEINQEKSGTGLPLDNPENAPSMDLPDGTSDTAKTKPEKPKARGPYYYYEIVPIDEVPEPEPILEHPTKPYALRRKPGDDNTESDAAPKPVQQVKRVRPPRIRPPRTRSQTKKKTRSKKPQEPSNRPPRPPKSHTLNEKFYCYKWVLEYEYGEEEIPIIEVPDQPYPFRSSLRNNKKNSEQEIGDATQSQQPLLNEACKETQAVASEASLEESDKSKKDTTKQNDNNDSLTNNTNVHLRTYVNENPDKRNNQSKDATQRSEEAPPLQQVAKQKTNTKKTLPSKDMNRPTDSSNTTTQSSDTSESSQDAEPLNPRTTRSRTRLSSKHSPVKTRNENKPEQTLKDDTHRELRKRVFGRVEKSVYEPLSKRPCHNEKEDIAPSASIVSYTTRASEHSNKRSR